jgi:hypothetical protein
MKRKWDVSLIPMFSHFVFRLGVEVLTPDEEDWFQGNYSLNINLLQWTFSINTWLE